MSKDGNVPNIASRLCSQKKVPFAVFFLSVGELFHRQTVEDRSNIRNYAKQDEQNCYQINILVTTREINL